MSWNGILLVDKESGLTSHDVVARTRKILKTSSVGHCGTLDPMATGLMVLLVGEATKLSSYLLERDKAYRLKVKLGISTDTLDSTGTLISEKPLPDLSLKEIADIALSLSGEFELQVPKFSAIKVAGQKLYEKARAQEDFAPPMKLMHFYNLKILSQTQNELELEMSCSKGTYIRSWAELLGQKLGCGAVLTELRRLESKPYHLEQAQTLGELADEALKSPNQPPKALIPMSETLNDWKTLVVEGQSLSLLRNGQIGRELKSQLITRFRPGVDLGVKVLNQNMELLALIGLDPNKGFVIRRVFNP